MITVHRLLLIVAVLGLSACVSGNDPATRGSMPSQTALAAANSTSAGSPALKAPAAVYLTAQYDVEAVRVIVPKSLTVSEANTYKPRADIVWRGEGFGDRHAQVEAIFEDAMALGTSALTNGQQVNLDIEVVRFHALTEKTRYSFGGMHEMTFLLTVSDAATGAIIDGPRAVIADVKASGGAAAIAEEQAGRTQRVVTVDRLAQVIRQELATRLSDEQLVARLNTLPAVATE